MITNFTRNNFIRSILAVSLAVLLAAPWGILMAASSSAAAQDEEYQNMSQTELATKVQEAEESLFRLETEEYRAKQDLAYDRINKYIITITEINSEVDGKNARAQTLQAAVDNHERDARIHGTELTETESSRIQELKTEIAQLKNEVADLTQRAYDLEAERATLEKSTWSRMKSIEKSYAERRQAISELIERMDKVYENRFQESAQLRSNPLDFINPENEISIRADSKPSIPTEAGLSADKYLEFLLAEWGGKIENSPFPERFWCTGVEEYWDIKPDIRGKRYLTFFRDINAAVQFSGGSGATDASVFELRAADLIETPEGRQYLQIIKNQLLSNADAEAFVFDIPNDKVYRETFLEKINPRPKFLVPLKPEPLKRPPQSKAPVSEAGLSNAERVKQITLNQALNQHMLETYPEFRGVDRSEYLLEPETAQKYLTEKFHRQMQNTLHEITLHETPETQNELTERMNEIADKHNPQATQSCIEQGKKTFNMQGENVKKMIARSRAFFSERIQEIRGRIQQGQQSLSQSRMPWHHWSVITLFTVVAIWDVYTAYEEGWEAAAWTAAKTGVAFAVIMISLPLIAGYSVLLSEFFAGGLAIAGFWHLWERVQNWVYSKIDAQSAEFIIGNKRALWIPPSNPPFEAAGRWVDISFFTFPGSPAAGLNHDTWHLKFRSQPDLLNAIIRYQYNLHSIFGDSRKIPPKFNREENLRVATRIIENEWARKYQEDFKKLQEAIAEQGARQRKKEKNLRYKLSRAKPTKPEGNILSVKIEPEQPSVRDNEIEVKAHYAVTGLPGDKVSAHTHINLVNQDNGREAEPIINSENIEYGIGEAYFMDVRKETMALSGPGDYELTFKLDLEPEGKEPKPHKINFTIAEDTPMEFKVPVPVNFREQDIRRIDPLFTGAKARKVEDVAYHQVWQSGPIAELEGHHYIDNDKPYKDLLIRNFEIDQYGDHQQANELYSQYRDVFAKEENARFDDNPANFESVVRYSYQADEWINFKAYKVTIHSLRAAYIYRDVFLIKCWISSQKGSLNDLSKRWQSFKQNSERLIDERLREIK